MNSRIKATIHGTWVPNGDDYELAIYPIVQRWREDNDRIIPQGSFSLINLHDDKSLDAILGEDYTFTCEVELGSMRVGNDGIQKFFTQIKNSAYEPSLELHNLGDFTDSEGYEYSVFLLITNYNLSITPASSKYAWDGMHLLSDIELDEDDDLEKQLLDALKILKGPSKYLSGTVVRN